MVPEVRIAAPFVEVITPRNAPHLAPIARALSSALAGELEQLLKDPTAVARIAARAREASVDAAAFDAFMARLDLGHFGGSIP